MALVFKQKSFVEVVHQFFVFSNFGITFSSEILNDLGQFTVSA